MSRLVFKLRNAPAERLDLSPLTPQALAGKSLREIESIRVGRSRAAARVGDVFALSGSTGAEIVFSGGSSRFDGVGAGLTDGGVIRVEGAVGAQLGRKMGGGSIRISGDAGPHAGSGMSGGRLEIGGNAGDCLGGPLAGEMHGIAGGILLVRGAGGALAGDRMRRGLIAVLGGAGDHAGARMIAGTLLVLGGVGAMPGYLMRRGTILLDRPPARPSPSFSPCGAPELAFARVLDRYLVGEAILRRPLLGSAPARLGGDNAVLGLGEILFPKV